MRKTITMVLAGLCLYNTMQAQNRIAISEAQYDAHRKLSFAKTAFAMPDKTNTSFIESLFGRQDNTEFVHERSYTGPGGYTHHIYQQYHLGLKVVGANVGLHERNNTVDYVNANYATITVDNLSTRIAVKDVGTIAEKIAADDKKVYGKPLSNLKSGKATLVFTRNKERNFILAYKVPLTSGQQTIYYYIDAASGELLKKEFTRCSTNAPGTGATSYSGTVGFTSDYTGSNYRLRQVRNGVNIATLNNNNSYSMPNGSAMDFTDNDNNWTAGEHPSDLVAIEVHWATQNVYDYWWNVHGRNSLDNSGIALNSYVHYGSSEANAYWE
ncbi:MAG TPA: hypothetical protein VHM26_14545, partial [Chitinophagaceae bacterium]|nr:hypothetical protein [Chitinophagaceae bacterium]